MVGREPAGPNETPRRRHPMNRAIDHLAEVFPLHTSAWAAWSANLRQPQLEGTWAISGHHPGRGPVYGQMVVTAMPGAAAQFTTDATLVYARDGRSVTHAGRAIVYTGFQWRGSSDAASDDTAWRQVMFVARDWSAISGRWFRGAFDEIGLNVTLTRVDAGPIVSGVHPQAVRTSTRDQELRIYGANLPADLAPADLSLGAGIEVLGVVSVTSDVATIRVSVSEDATVGARDVFVGRGTGQRALVVYDEVDRVTVEPLRGMARVGGVVVPKQYEQFDAVAWHEFDRELSASVEALVAGLDWATRAGARLINLSLGTAHAAHADALRAAVGRATDTGAVIVAAAADGDVRWLPGTLPSVVPVTLDWDCPRDCYRWSTVDDAVVFAASGYPRPIPGVPPPRNLRGLSFAVANLTGFTARALQSSPVEGFDEVVRVLVAGCEVA